MPKRIIERRALPAPRQGRGSLTAPRARWPGPAEELKRGGCASGRNRAARAPQPGEVEAAWRDLHLALLAQAASAPPDHLPPATLEDELHRIVLDLLRETTRIARLLNDD